MCSIFTWYVIDTASYRMKMGKQMIFWLVALAIVAAVVYYFFTPRGAYLEGFASLCDTYSKRTDVREGFALHSGTYPTSIGMADGKSAISNLYFMKNGASLTDASLNAVMVDMSGVCPASALEMSKGCFNAIVGKFALNTGEITAPANVSAVAAENIVAILNKQLGLGYSTLSPSAIQGAMATQTDLSGVCQVSATGTITKECYNALINAFVINANKDGVVCSTSDVDETKKAPTSLTSDIKDTAKTIGTSISNAASKLPETIADAKKSYDTKCTVEFGKEAATPQTKAATPKTPDSTCDTTGTISKTMKTPAVEQGCEFAQKFPKVNVINLRDYVHKDEVPCWSCKL